MEQRLTIITLGASDLQASRQFYTEKLGWKPSEHSNEHITFYELPGIQLALFDRKELAKDAGVSSEGSGFRGFTLAHNVGSEEEVNELFSRFQASGITIVKEPKKVFWGGYSGYIADPDSNLIEIAYNPFM